MGLGVNSLDSSVVLPVFQASRPIGELTEDLPNSSSPLVASLAPDVFVSSESSSPLEALRKSLEEMKKLEQSGQITDPALLKQIRESELREQTYKELLSQGESSELTAFIVDDVRSLKNIIENTTNKHQQWADLNAKEQNQQNIIYQRYTGGDREEIASPNATWRQKTLAARPEDMEKGILENFQAEDQELASLSQSNPGEAQRRLNNKREALESSKGLGIQSLLKEENVSRETKYNEQIQYTIKTNTENLLKNNTRELEELSRIPESDLTVQQRERKETLKDQNQAIEEMMRKEGWLDDYLRNMNEADRKRLEEKAKDGTLDDEETNQILNRGLADSDKSGRIMRGFYTADEEEFRKLMGDDKQSFYDKYSDRYQLDKVLKKEMALSLRQGTYSDASYYGSLDSRAASDGEGAKNSNLSPEQKVANMILERESHGLRGAAAKNFTNKDIAQKLGLKPDHPIVLAIAAGDYGLAQELSVGLNVETSVNAIAAATTEPDNQGFDAWLSFSNSAIPTDNNSVTSTEESNKPFNPFAEDKLSNLNLTFS
jgi:hypothetical protein